MQVKKDGNTMIISDLTDSEMQALEDEILFIRYMEASDKQGPPEWLKKILSEEKD